MNMENKKNLKYITGACFAAAAVIRLILQIQNGFSVWGLLYIAAAALIAVSVFVSIPVLMTVGSGLYLALSLRSLIQYTGTLSYPEVSKHWFLGALLSCTIWTLLLIAGMNAKSAKSLGLVAGILAVVR